MKKYTEHSKFTRKRYLQLMGIDVFRSRALTDNSPEYYRHDLINLQNQVVGVLLADALLRNEEERQLVEKIAKATKKQTRAYRRCVKVSRHDLAGLVIILLGPGVAQWFSAVNPSRTIISHAPSELLGDPALKAETWKALKKAIQWMA